MTAGAWGIDISSWQHPAGEPIDWHAVRDSGVTFAIVKATQGATYRNPWYVRDMEDAFAAGLLVGTYHYFVASDSPVDQATNFKSVVGQDKLDLGYWLDFEVAPAAQWTLAGEVNAFTEACKPELTAIGLYCTAAMWEDLKGANVTPAALWMPDTPDAAASPGTTILQVAPGPLPGVPADVDRDILVTVRGINLPTSPLPRPVASAVSPPLLEPEPEPAEDEASATE